MKPLAIDLYAGLGGWAEGLLAEGYDVIGFDIERHEYYVPDSMPEGDGHKGTNPIPKRGWTQGCAISLGMEGAAQQPRTRLMKYPAQLVIQDVTTLHGSQFRNATLIVASPPCQAYSYRAMPWKRAKALPPPDNALFDACFRIQREACAAAGRHIPMVVENVCGAQKWAGRAAWHYGSFYLWGDVPALMPSTLHRKVRGFNFHQHEKTGKPGGSFQSAAVDGLEFGGGWWHDSTNNLIRKASSKSPARKAASAQIAKIPFALASWIAKVYYPDISQG